MTAAEEQQQPPAKKARKTTWAELEDQVPADWKVVLKNELSSFNFKKIKSQLSKLGEKTIYPPIDNVFAFMQCPYANVKVVILGQDPYHGVDQAHGLCFSVLKTRPPPSLVNIYKELVTDVPGFKIPAHGNLASWVDQGVLLLNASLTVEKAAPNSHAKIGWQQFTDAIISRVNKLDHVVFMLWGAYAQSKEALLNHKKHLILKCPHPSPFSANKGLDYID